MCDIGAVAVLVLFTCTLLHMRDMKMMKKEKLSRRLIITSVLSLLCIALAAQFLMMKLHQGEPVNTLSIPPENDIGIDYYHESMDYLPVTNEQIDRDLNLISQVTHKIKVYHSPFVHTHMREDKTTANALDVVENIVRRAKAHHMYVVWTENDDSIKLTDAAWPDYTRAVIDDAANAHNAGADEFVVGNELSNHNNGDPGYNPVQFPERIKQLVSDCASNFPGPRSYEDVWYTSKYWHSSGLGPLHKIYFTLYEPWHVFENALNQIVAYFGKNAEIGEISTMTTKSALKDDEQAWTRDLMQRYDYARQKGASIWLFTFCEPQNDSFGLFQTVGSTLQPHDIWDYLTKRKTLSYT